MPETEKYCACCCGYHPTTIVTTRSKDGKLSESAEYCRHCGVIHENSPHTTQNKKPDIVQPYDTTF